MLGFSLAEAVLLFFAISICLGLVIAWILKSEASRNVFRREVMKLKSQIDKLERDRAILLEEMENARAGAPVEEIGKNAITAAALKEMADKNDALEREIARLKAELQDAKSSLEEVYKALVQ
ncbi:MAG: hypothetical protein NC938_07210 [Candidatus Omnitrophica bacterium]|nr:hypothetical protein [Candidatus Omnitrophota bacterium]MCM8791453.1 hypothetical protein [Candidatus Omnitrophota bacterium]